MRPNGQARLTIVNLDYDVDSGADLGVESTEKWPLNNAWRPAILAKVKRDEPMAGAVSMSGPTTMLDATIWIANYPDLRKIVERSGTEITIEFSESRSAPSTFWKVIHTRLEFAISIGIALDCKRQTDA